MSAWYVWSALGMYPMTPGTADLALGSPLFPRAVLALPSGATLTIDGSGAAPRRAVRAGRHVERHALEPTPTRPPAALTSGGTLRFTLTARPQPSWAAGPAAAPPSYGSDTLAAAGPARSRPSP